LKDPVDGDSDQVEREEQQPDDRVENEGEERQRPTKDKQDQPEQEFCHTVPPLSDYGTIDKELQQVAIIDHVHNFLYHMVVPFSGLPSDTRNRIGYASREA
jgi:hypothetical protein